MTDGQFYKIFGILTVGIIIIAIIIAILANIFASYSFHPSNQYKTEIEKKTVRLMGVLPLDSIDLLQFLKEKM